MALGFVVSDHSDGTATGTVSGISSSARSIRIANSTTGNTSTTNISGVTSYAASFTTLRLGLANSLTITTYSATGGTGSVLQTMSASVSASVRAPTVTATTSADASGCSWTAPSMINSAYGYGSTLLQYSINGGAYTTYGSVTANPGSISSASVTVGYSTPVTWKVTHTYFSNTYHANANGATGSGSATTGAAGGGGGGGTPPTAPNPITGLGATDNTTNIVLAWTAASGGATGYQVYRNGVFLANSTTTTGYTDSSPPARPVTYTVYAYNSNSSGTTKAAGVSVTVNAAGVTTAGQTQQMIL